MEKVPIRVIDPTNKFDQAALDRQLAAADAQIDHEVHALYDLSEEEIIVESVS